MISTSAAIAISFNEICNQMFNVNAPRLLRFDEESYALLDKFVKVDAEHADKVVS